MIILYWQSLPGSFGFLSKVTNLNLSGNCLESIPPELSSMTSLASLDLTNNSLTEIPWTLKDLSHLGDLNRSSSWPYKVWNFRDFVLEKQQVDFNSCSDKLHQLEGASSWQQQNPRWEESKLVYNTLAILCSGLKSEDVENIVNVRLLDLRENKITQLPDEITCLQLLERLDVSNNDLSGLPFVLGCE